MNTETADKKELEAEGREIAKHRGDRTTGGQITRLEIKSFSEMENLAVILGKSDIVPKDMIGKPANILLALMFGNELGLTPAQALQNIMVVNGRPCLWGDATMGLVMASNVYEDSKDEFDPALEGGAATFHVKRRGKDWVKRTFSMKDAATAKLDKKAGPWQEYPKRMLFHRARAWALRDAFPDVLKGIRYFEEERDVVNTTAERVPAKAYAMPGDKVETKAAPAPTAAAEAPAERIDQFLVGGGATSTEFDGDCWVVRDDADTPVKYYTDNEDFFKAAKAAKEAKAYVTATWTDRASKKGPVRWLTALSLRG